MPSIAQNVEQWGKNYSWEHGGDEWSEPWGGSSNLWSGSILPRVRPYLPAGSILEIAPGFGRFTQYLKDQCASLIGVDLNERCAEACRQRFGSSDRLQFFSNDGRSLDMVPDHSIDLIFSFDSLVHVEADVLDAYLSAFPRILKKDGVAFVHHSNYGAYPAPPLAKKLSKIPVVRRILRNTPLGMPVNTIWRAESVSASTFREICARNGLRCVGQELINWTVDYLSDCISVVTRSDSTAWPSDSGVTENYGFMAEAATIRGAHGGRASGA